MLVYNIIPLGVLHLGDLKIYGAATGRSPVDIPWEFYKDNRHLFVDATYRSQDLERIFGQPFDPIAFKITELKYLPYNVLQHLAGQMGVYHYKYSSQPKLVVAILNGLRHGYKRCVTCGKKFVMSRQFQKECCNHGSKS